MFCLNTRLRSFQEEMFEAFVPEFLDHITSVTWNDSGNKEPRDWEAQDNYLALVMLQELENLLRRLPSESIRHATMSTRRVSAFSQILESGVANDVTMDTAFDERCFVFSFDSLGSTEVFRGKRATKEKG